MRRNNLSKNLSRIAQDKADAAAEVSRLWTIRDEMAGRARQQQINNEMQRSMLDAANLGGIRAQQAAKDNTLWQKYKGPIYLGIAGGVVIAIIRELYTFLVDNPELMS